MKGNSEYQKLLDELQNSYLEYFRHSYSNNHQNVSNGSSTTSNQTATNSHSRNREKQTSSNQKTSANSDQDDNGFYPFTFPQWQDFPKIPIVNFPSINLGNSFQPYQKRIQIPLQVQKLRILLQGLNKLWRYRLIRYSVIIMGTGISVLVAWVVIEWVNISKYKLNPLPYPAGVSPHLIYTKNGELLLDPDKPKIHREFELDHFSTHLKNAVIASEDRRFYKYNFLDLIGLARAITETIKGNTQGGSTLSQQLAKKLFLQDSKLHTLRRKMQQILLAIRLEFAYEKDEILEAYLNRIYVGNENYPNEKDPGAELDGFEEAAQFYFDKSAQDLDISEAATLVGILPLPNKHNPITNYNQSLKMRNLRIAQMLELGYISIEEAEKAKQLSIPVKPKKRRSPPILAPYYYQTVLDEFGQIKKNLPQEKFESGQFIIETTLDSNAQREAERILKNNLANQGVKFNYHQGALVMIDTRNGQILALVGGTSYSKVKYNLVTQSERQPASTFKLFTYLAALEKGISPEDNFSCQSLILSGQKFQPCARSSGNITMEKGLALSENPVALRVAQKVGLPHIVKLAESMDIEIPNSLESSPNLVLGQHETTVLKMTGAYAVIANQGIWHKPHTIIRIRDRNTCQNAEQISTCSIIYDSTQSSQKQPIDQPSGKTVVSQEVANQMIKMLRKVVTEGTAMRANITPNVVGKTGTSGTSNDNRDLWFIGIVSDQHLVTGVRLGNYCDKNLDPQISCNTKGKSSHAVDLWTDYMKEILSKK